MTSWSDSLLAEAGLLRAVLRTRSQHRDGQRLYVDFTFGLVKDAQGRVLAVQALARDATQAHLRQQGADGTAAASGAS